MPTVKKILHYQNNGITKTELVEVPQSWQDVAALGLNIYGIFWLANIIVFCFEFLKKNPIYRTTIIWPKENLKRLEEIQLPDTTLNFLTEWICAVRSRNSSKKFLSVPKGILLVGPPGTAKTTLAQAIGHETNLPIICETISHFYSGPENQWSKIRNIFKLAQKWSPSILFLDDMGTLGNRPQDLINLTQKGVITPKIFQTRNQLNKTKSKQKPTNKEMNLLTHFLIELDGLQKRNNVFVIGATHSLEGIDPALLRPGRFEKVIHLKPLTTQQKIQLLQNLLKKNKHNLTQTDWAKLRPLTETLSGATVESIYHRLILQNQQTQEITLIQIEEAIQYFINQQKVKENPIKINTKKKQGKGLALKKWWIEEIATQLSSRPKKGWNNYYAQEPLGDWYQQAFVDNKSLPRWISKEDDFNEDELSE